MDAVLRASNGQEGWAVSRTLSIQILSNIIHGPAVQLIPSIHIRHRGFHIQQHRHVSNLFTLRPTCAQIGYITPAVLGVPDASERGTKLAMAHTWVDGCITAAIYGVPNASQQRKKSEAAHAGQMGYITPSVRGVPNASEQGTK